MITNFIIWKRIHTNDVLLALGIYIFFSAELKRNMQISTTDQTFLSQKSGQLATIRNISILGNRIFRILCNRTLIIVMETRLLGGPVLVFLMLLNKNNDDESLAWPQPLCCLHQFAASTSSLLALDQAVYLTRGGGMAFPAMNLSTAATRSGLF